MLPKYTITIMQVFVVIFLTINFVLAPNSDEENEDIKSTICIGNIPKTSSEEEVKALLIPYGDLEKFVLLRDHRNNKILGYAFSVLKNVSLTDQAVNELNGSRIGNNILTVQKSNANQAVFVEDIPLGVDENVVNDLLAYFGDFTSFNYVNDVANGADYNYAFCEYTSPRKATEAYAHLNGVKKFGTDLIVRKLSYFLK